MLVTAKGDKLYKWDADPRVNIKDSVRKIQIEKGS